jgi:rare lipoprotein A
MLMQTKLRIVGLLFVATLLWIFPASAAIKRTNGRTARPTPKRYIGVASWCGGQHQGRKMANGQRFDRHQLTAACWYFPLGTTVRVVNLENGKSELVTITDRGPNLRLDRIIDLSEAAAGKLGYIRQGLTSVFLFPVVSIDPEQAKIASHLIEPFSDEVSVRSEEQTSDTSE